MGTCSPSPLVDEALSDDKTWEAVLEEHRGGMVGEIGFDGPRQLHGRGGFSPGIPSDSFLPMGWSAEAHGFFYQPMRARRFAMWAV